MPNFFSKIFLSVLASLMMFGFSFANPVAAKWYTQSLDVKVGDTVTINLFLEPENGKAVYTIANTLFYNPDNLKFEDATFAPDWFPVNTPATYLDDEASGIIERTAGFPNGVKSRTQYLTYKFTAEKAGSTSLSIEGGVALDVNNMDLGLQQKVMNINISDKKEETKNASTSEIRTLDLALNINGKIAIYDNTDYTFSVGNPVSTGKSLEKLNLVVVNQQGQEVYTKTFYANDLQNSNYVVTVPGDTLNEGEYTIYLQTFFQGNILPVVTSKQIGVLKDKRTFVDKHKIEIYTFLFMVLLAATAWHLHREHDEIRRIRNYYKNKK